MHCLSTLDLALYLHPTYLLYAHPFLLRDLPSQPEPEQPVAKEGEPVSLFAPIPLEQEAPPVTSTSTNPSAAQKIVPQSMPANS